MAQTKKERIDELVKKQADGTLWVPVERDELLGLLIEERDERVYEDEEEEE